MSGALPPGFTLDAPAPAQVPPPDPAALPPGFTIDQSLTAAPVPLGERFMTNLRSGFQGTLLGSAANYLAEHLAPNTNPIDPNTGQPLGGLTPRQQVQQSVIEDQNRAALLPGWQQEDGPVNRALAGGTALAGSLAGGMASPESLIAGPEAYGVVRLGEPAAPAILRAAGVQAGVQGAANAGAQGINIAGGTQDAFSPGEVAQSAAMGAAIGAVHPAAGLVVNRMKGLEPGIQIRGADGSLRTVKDPGEWGGQPFRAVEPSPTGLPPGFTLDAPPAPEPAPAPAPEPVPPQAPVAAPPEPVATLTPPEPTPAAPAAPPAALPPEPPAPVAAPPAPVPEPAPAASPAASPAAPPVAAPIETPSPAPSPIETPSPAPSPVPAAGPREFAGTGDVTGTGDAGRGTAAPPPEPGPGQAVGQVAPVPVAPDPNADPNRGTVTTSAGRKLDVRYEVVPASDLVPASGDLQPRDRAGRAASEAQIQSISANLDPSRLMRAPESDRGAPIVGPDNVIESGNGRVQAITRAAQQNPDAYARYVQALKDAGHQTDGIDTPILVARRTTDLTPQDRIASIQEHNQSATQRMSAPEQARVDAQALTPDLLAKYDHTQPATSASNRGFVRDWINTLPEAERNGVQDTDGNLSADGQRRLNGAMLARAYDDRGVLARGLESTDDATRSVSGAMADAAPAWANLRAGVEKGDIPKEFDTSKQLVQAADIVRQAREKRQTMSDVLSQQDAFNPMDPVTEQYVRALYSPDGKRPASRPAIADTLRRYAEEGQRQTTGAGLFGDAETVKPVDALRAIVSRRDNAAEPTQTSLLGNGTKLQPAEPAAPVRQPEPALTKTAPPAEPAKPPIDRTALAAEQADLERKTRNLANALASPDTGKAEKARMSKKFETMQTRLEQIRAQLKEADAAPREPVATKLAADDRPVPLHDAGTAAITTGPTRSPLGGVRPVRDFNEGTSPYRQVFRDAGHDPDLMVSRPLPEQNKVIADHIQTTFGFKDVQIDPRQHPKEVRDQLSNFYQNAREMANVLGMPYDAIGLDGRVTFTTKPYRQKGQALGTYYPRERMINIPGRSNSFAHEWTHAFDHYLSDALANNPKAMRMLSETKGITEGKVAGKPFLPGTPAEAFANVLRTIYGKDAATAAEALRLQYEVRTTKDAKAFLAAQRRLEQIETEFAGNARTAPGGLQYWGRPAEMLARAHEAYVSEMIQRQGGDTRGVAKPYYDTPPGTKSNGFEKFYPQQAERDQIFQAFTDLHDRVRAETLLGKDPAGARPDGLDIVDRRVWDRMADPKREPGLWGVLKREFQAQKNLRARVWDRMGFNESAASPGRLGVATRAADAGRAATYSIRGIGNAIVARQPTAQARRAYQHIMDLIAPAEHIRTSEDAAGRHIGPVFEEDVREHARPNINRLANILDQHRLNWHDMSSTQNMLRDVQTEKLMLRHVLTEGDASTFVPPGGTKAVPIPANIRKAAGAIRKLLDDEWERNRKAGIDVGYAKSGYFPRMYDDHKIFGDEGGFRQAADKLHRVIFEQDVGDDPTKLLEAHDRLPKDVRAQLEPDVQDGITKLRQNLREQDKIQSRINDGTSPDPGADQAKIDQLAADAADLHDQLHDPVRDLFAQTAAKDWYDRINNGDPTSFDTRGPNASYVNKRVLPPEADAIMRDYMVNDPTVALPAYFQQSARRVAFADRFGVNGSKLDALIDQATQGKARGEDNQKMRRLVEAVTGKQKSGLPSEVERAANVIHAVGSIALMPRAAWSSLSEPVVTLARTGSIKASYQALANQIGDIVRTSGSKERAQLANALGLTTSHLYDSVIADRTDAHYRDAPGLSKLTANYYKRIGLTQLTNSQRRSVMGAGHTALDAWSQDFLGANARLKRDAAAQFRDLGVADKDHANFAKWVTEHKGLPSLADLDTAGGRLWGQAVSRLTDKIIQDPMRVDKPLMSQNPLGRLAYGLMSFNYSFYHNIIEHTLDTHIARIKEGYTDVRAAGGGKAAALAGTAAPIARAGVHIGASAAAVYAASLATTALREAIFNQAKWKEHEDTGDLGSWLSDLAVSRTGVNGPLDPVVQAITGLKYERDLSGLMSGAQVGYFLQAAGDMLKPFAGFGSPNTNTSEYNAIKGAWNMFGVPAAGVALTSLPGGPIASAIYGGALQAVTSRGAADAVAASLVGPKGTGPDGEPPPEPQPKDPDAEPTGTGTGLLGGVPLGLADDFAAPAMKAGLPLWQRLPVVGKAVTAGVVGATVASKLANEFGKWKEK